MAKYGKEGDAQFDSVDDLAREIYLRTVCDPASQASKLDYHAEQAYEKAEVFYQKLKSRKE